MILLNPNYWDCECESNYIHEKAETYEGEQPDSIQEEINKL